MYYSKLPPFIAYTFSLYCYLFYTVPITEVKVGNDIEVNERDSVQLNCSTDGQPNPQFTWYRGDGQLLFDTQTPEQYRYSVSYYNLFVSSIFMCIVPVNTQHLCELVLYVYISIIIVFGITYQCKVLVTLVLYWYHFCTYNVHVYTIMCCKYSIHS